MILGGTSGGQGDSTADDQPSGQTFAPPETAASRHERILQVEERARHARADLLQLLAEADAVSGPSMGRHRNETLWWADSQRKSKNSAGHDVRRGRFMFIDCPAVGAAFRAGNINEDHVVLYLNLWSKRAIRNDVERDLDGLIELAHNTWAQLGTILEAWETITDPIDPNEYAERAHTNRSFDTTEPVAQQILIQLLTTSAAFAQIEPALTAKAKQLFEADWAEAKARVGDDATMADLLRTSTQRRHDALVMTIRNGIGADPSLANLVANIVADAETMQEEAEQRDAAARGEEPPARDTTNAIERAKRRRCETQSGISLSPADALDYAIAAHVRLFINDTETSDFEASAKTRLFKGPQRVGIMIRDRHCTGAGCDTSAWQCQVDHTIPYGKGGRTVPSGGKVRCDPCHRHKTRLEMLGLWPPDWN